MERYNRIAIGFHWLVGIIMIGLLALGLIMVDMPKPDKYVFYGWHKAFGIFVLGLVVLRLLWRLTHRTPPLPSSTPPLQAFASKLTHWALYAMMLIMPLAGWVMSSAGGHPISMFSISIPPIVEENKELGAIAHDIHEIGGWVLLGLVLLHIAAALYHQFIQKDGLMWRILPTKKH